MSTQLQKYLLALTLALSLGACSDKNDDDSDKKAPQTGNEVFEEEQAPEDEQPPAEIEPPLRGEETGEIYYVYATQLRVRTSPEILADGSNIAGYLDLNDQVMVLSSPDENGMVKIKIVKSASKIKPASEYYVSMKYLSKNPQTEREQTQPENRFFMIQNIATEKLRVYEKLCKVGCAHKLILEADVAVGEKSKSDPGLMTIVGNFHITKWIKFYQDGGGRYPSWFDPQYPMPPKPGAGVTAWTSKKVLPYKGAQVRGAFGWYTAFPGPNASSQWTHGTLGWGVDKTKYIEATRGFWANLFLDPRSHGCTRTDNETIAYLRSLLPVKTPIIKVYAKEAYNDSSRSGYSTAKSSWSYILTKNGVRVDGELAEREAVLKRGTPRSEWLEEGTYEVDAFPDAKKFKSGSSGAKAGKNGNVYGLDSSEMRGVFLVDAGLLVDYSHPSGLRKGGYPDRLMPDYVRASGSNYQLP